MKRLILTSCLCVILTAGFAATTAFADPLPGEKLKFIQEPMVELNLGGETNPQVYYGHDEPSTAWLVYEDPTGTYREYGGDFMADDFADTSDQPVAHVQWWGSYFSGTAGPRVNKFLICFETDVPVDDPGNEYGYSYPGYPILSQIVERGPLSPGSGTFTENSIHPGGDPLYEQLFEYNAELKIPFPQEPDTVYWLKIVALVDLEVELEWGWHNRDYTVTNPLASVPPAVVPGEHIQGFLSSGTEDIPIWHFQDDAVAGGTQLGVQTYPDGGGEDIGVEQWVYGETYYEFECDGPEEISEYSKDLAFALYSPVPEPATIALLGLGALSLLRRKR